MTPEETIQHNRAFAFRQATGLRPPEGDEQLLEWDAFLEGSERGEAETRLSNECNCKRLVAWLRTTPDAQQLVMFGSAVRSGIHYGGNCLTAVSEALDKAQGKLA